MKKIFLAFVLIFSCFCFLPKMTEAQVAILCYHEVDHPNDSFAVTSKNLEQHINYMKKAGYHFVTLDEYLAYTDGKLQLPDKSVMLTFDDGYESFYTKVYPLLQKYQVPAMLAIVTSWTDGEGLPTDVRAVATWAQLREMEQSGLVTIVSHTHAMHKQQAIDPQGDRSGVAANRLYLNNRYETDEEYERRLQHDMAETQRLFVQNLGHPSRALVWPYGMYSGASVRAAQANGMKATFLLDGGINAANPTDQIYAKRMIMGRDTTTKRLQTLLTKNHDAWNSRPLRMAQIDIDNLYDKDATRLQRNVQNTIDNLYDSKVQLVALQAFADPDGDGDVDGVYFYNKEIPVVADVFNTIVNTMQQQGLTVVAWMPGLTYQNFVKPDGSNLVQGADKKTGWYRRISPFDTESLNQVQNLYRDLSNYTPASGILFQDDLYLNDYEDVSPYGKAAYEKAFGKAYEQKEAAKNPVWTKLKTQTLDKVAQGDMQAFKQNRPLGIMMRDIYDAPVVHPEAETWFAQNYQDCLKNYDYTVVMAYPQMNHENDAQAYLQSVAKAVKDANGTDKTIVKIQTYDWNKEAWLNKKDFDAELKTLQKAGVRNRGAYPQSYHKWER